MNSRDMTAVAEAEQDEQDGQGGAWLRLDTGELAVRIRHLQDLLDRGVSVTDARLVEGADETWSIWVRLSDRQGEFRVNQVRFDQAKTYRAIALALDTVWNDFRYQGTIVLSTERRRAPRPPRGIGSIAPEA